MRAVAGLAIVAALGTMRAGATTINFEQYAGGTAITTQYDGVTIAGGTEQRAGVFGLDAVYSPHSGTGYLQNTGTSQITMNFGVAQTGVSGWYSAAGGAMTISAYDAQHVLLATQSFSPSLGANAMWSIGANGTTSLVFSGLTGSVALDDVTYTSQAVAVTPEPGSLVLLGTGLCGGAWMCILQSARMERRRLAEQEGLQLAAAG